MAEPWRDSEDWNRALRGGAVAGIIGGIVIALAIEIAATLQGHDLWTPLKGAGFPFLHERALAPGFDGGAVLLGLLGHFAVSIGWGILFGIAAIGLSQTTTVWFGALWGLIVWAAMFYVVLPVVGAGSLARGQPALGEVVNHVLFGLAVGVGFLPYQRTHTGGRHWGSRRHYAGASR